MGKDYCLCQGYFNKDLESNILSSKRAQKDFSLKNFFNNLKRESFEKLEESKNLGDSNDNINEKGIYKRVFTFKDININSKEENKNSNYYKFRGSANIIESDIKEEDNEDESSLDNNKINNSNQHEHITYKLSKGKYSNFSMKNNKNNKEYAFYSFNENKNNKNINENINKTTNKNKKEDESISADSY